MILFSCKREPVDHDNRYLFKQPSNFPKPTYTFDKNAISKAGFELGKKLFFDPILSRDGSVACSNCHLQSLAFADSPVHPISIGIDQKLGKRNAPSLANMAFFDAFFWDGGVNHLDFVPINAIESPVEMDENLERLIEKLNAEESYLKLYNEAFGISEITLPYTLHAISQYTALMVSANSKYDHYVRNEHNVMLTNIELEGLELFNQKCSSCHKGALFTDFSYRNNGLDSVFRDKGRYTITSSVYDMGTFRVPSLRNVERTAPYMHDGRFKTIDEVLDHYDGGMLSSQTLDTIFQKNPDKLGISLSDDDKIALKAFLYTLTDHTFIRDTLFFK